MGCAGRRPGFARLAGFAGSSVVNLQFERIRTTCQMSRRLRASLFL